MKKIATQYFQYDQKFITTTLNYEDLSKITTVLKYGEDELGYQREVNQLHLNRMVKTLQDTKEVLSPTSIILGVNSSDIEKCLEDVILHGDVDLYDQREKLLSLDLSKVNFKFRIVDGQHRIKAFEKYLNNIDIHDPKKKILQQDYIFNIVIMVLEEEDRIEEVKIFRSINSKSKPLKTDLAMLAKYKYELFFKKQDIDFIEHLKTRIIFFLNEDEAKHEIPYWKNGIKVDVNDRHALGSIGFKAYGDSIHNLVKLYADDNTERFENFSEQVFTTQDEILNESADYIIKHLILPAWDIVYKKWPDTFKRIKNIQNEESAITYYDKSYYIQQNMGVKSLHGLLTKLYTSDDFEKTINDFKYLIENSLLTSEDWKKNGKMGGLSSEAGFKIIQEMIKRS